MEIIREQRPANDRQRRLEKVARWKSGEAAMTPLASDKEVRLQRGIVASASRHGRHGQKGVQIKNNNPAQVNLS